MNEEEEKKVSKLEYYKTSTHKQIKGDLDYLYQFMAIFSDCYAFSAFAISEMGDTEDRLYYIQQHFENLRIWNIIDDIKNLLDDKKVELLDFKLIYSSAFENICKEEFETINDKPLRVREPIMYPTPTLF